MKSMINKNFKVIDIAHGKALVNQPFDKFESFSLALDSEEMELVLNGTNNKGGRGELKNQTSVTDLP